MMPKYMHILILLFLIINAMSLNLSMRTRRNEFKTCSSNYNCEECREEGYFKSCVQNICYCCNMDQKCKNQIIDKL